MKKSLIAGSIIAVMVATYTLVFLYVENIQYKKFCGLTHGATIRNHEHPILRGYRRSHEALPSSREALKDYVLQNYQPRPNEDDLATFLYLHDSWHVMLSEDKRWFIIYDEGPNLRNDSMRQAITQKDLNFFNYFIIEGDVLILKQAIELHR